MCDFFDPKYRTELSRSDRQFGIGDDGRMAFTTGTESETVTFVNNPAEITLQFVPVDHNIPIRNERGEDVSLCDAMIYTLLPMGQRDIYFVELKDRSKNWISEAVEQLKSTIKYFSHQYPNDLFRFRVATASNKKKPFFDYSHKDMCVEFRNETGYRLNINSIIDIHR